MEVKLRTVCITWYLCPFLPVTEVVSLVALSCGGTHPGCRSETTECGVMALTRGGTRAGSQRAVPRHREEGGPPWAFQYVTKSN